MFRRLLKAGARSRWRAEWALPIHVQAVLIVGLFLTALHARADEPIGCAGDGAPRGAFELSVFGAVEAVAFAGGDAQRVHGDDADADGNRVDFRTVRIGLCGRFGVRSGAVLYNLVYEPWDLVERAHLDARRSGRLAASEVGYAPWSWLTLWGGVHKVAFSYGHDEPEGLLALPTRPFVSSSIAPDRRFGFTADANLGAARVTVGVYEGGRDLVPDSTTGALGTARLRLEPIGPVGQAITTVADGPFWRRRPRFGLNASALYAYTPTQSGFAVGGDVPFKWGPLGVVVEYLYARGTPSEAATLTPNARLTRQGLTVETALHVARPAELAGRYEWSSSADPLQRFQAATVGASLFLVRTLLRLQFEYSHKFHRGVVADDDVALFVLALNL